MPAMITAAMLKCPVAASTPATGMITSLGKGTPQLLMIISPKTTNTPPLVTHWPIAPPMGGDCGLRCREHAPRASPFHPASVAGAVRPGR